GLERFKGSEISVSEENYQVSQGLRGAMLGAVPSQWPSWFEPQRRHFTGPAVAGFDASIPLTDDGTVFAVPTPGHMPGHLSVAVRTPDVTYLLAGDPTYDETWFNQRIAAGPASAIGFTSNTMLRI